MWKKAVKLGSVVILCGVFGGVTGFLGSNLVIDNGRIEFKNTRNQIFIGDGAGSNGKSNGRRRSMSQCRHRRAFIEECRM